MGDEMGDAVQKFGAGKIFLMFWKISHQGCIYLIQNTIKTVIFWNIITI